MITLVRTLTIANGKNEEAILFATDIATLVNKITDKELRVITPVACGDFQRVAWVVNYDNLAELEGVMDNIQGNEEFNTALKRTAGLFIDGSGVDEIWKDVPAG